MRVLVVAEQLRGRVPGGIGTYVRGLARGLQALGADSPDITMWASRGPRNGADPVAELGPCTFSPLPAWALSRAWALGLGGAPAPAEAVHATSLAVPPGGRIPLSVMVHDLAWRHYPEAYPAHGRRWHEKALRRALHRADTLVAPSASTADDLRSAGARAEQVYVVEEGSDHLPPPDHDGAMALLRGLGVGSDYLLTVSTLEPRKNLVRLVEAYRSARASLPEPWPLVVVGPSGWGDVAAKLPNAAAAPGVVLAGAVSDEILCALYARARLLAYVPLREGFGLPALEAMRMGTPVVASPVPSTGTPGSGETAREVEPTDADSIAEGLVEVATDDGVRRLLVEAGHRRASELTWERTARRHVELWRAMQAAGPRGRRGPLGG